ncbi:MAG: hypothetical protein KatS3mg014_0133 [Actinomycetota bacterium]|nr:MAG: hypothetical protein KatS3mg014_0133 [Actinomycetota bacterium]
MRRAAEGRETLSPELLTGLGPGPSRATSRAAGRAAAETEERTARIERAIAGHGWHVVYQPVVDLASRAVVGWEALAWFTDPPGGGPQAWFAEAAEVGLGVELESSPRPRRPFAALRRIPLDTYLAINVSQRTVLSLSAPRGQCAPTPRGSSWSSRSTSG